MNFIRGAVALAVVTFLGLAVVASAQEDEQTWTEPRNLSQAGASSQPQLHSLGDEYLLLWRDEIDGLFFTLGSGTAWPEPERLALPRAGEDGRTREDAPPMPVLAMGAAEVVHAVWQAEESGLYYSRSGGNAGGGQ